MNIISLYCNKTCINYASFITISTSFCPWANILDHPNCIPPFVEPLLIILITLRQLAWHALSCCRRTSVRPPDDTEKSVAHRLQCAMPFIVRQLCYPSKISPTILVKLAFSLLRQSFFSMGAPPSHIHIPRMGKTAPECIRRTPAIIQSESSTQGTKPSYAQIAYGKCCARLFNYLIWLLRVMVEGWDIG